MYFLYGVVVSFSVIGFFTVCQWFASMVLGRQLDEWFNRFKI